VQEATRNPPPAKKGEEVIREERALLRCGRRGKRPYLSAVGEALHSLRGTKNPAFSRHTSERGRRKEMLLSQHNKRGLKKKKARRVPMTREEGKRLASVYLGALKKRGKRRPQFPK